MGLTLIKEEDALDRTKWKNDIQHDSGDARWWEKPKEEEIVWGKYKFTGVVGHPTALVINKCVIQYLEHF